MTPLQLQQIAALKDEFARAFRLKLAGFGLFGTVSELRDGPLARASQALEIPAVTAELLAEMSDWWHRRLREIINPAVAKEMKK